MHNMTAEFVLHTAPANRRQFSAHAQSARTTLADKVHHFRQDCKGTRSRCPCKILRFKVKMLSRYATCSQGRKGVIQDHKISWSYLRCSQNLLNSSARLLANAVVAFDGEVQTMVLSTLSLITHKKKTRSE